MKIKFPGSGHEHIRKFKGDSEVGKGDLIWVETPKNPMCEIEDIRVKKVGFVLTQRLFRKLQGTQEPFALWIVPLPLLCCRSRLLLERTSLCTQLPNFWQASPLARLFNALGHSDVLSGVLVCAEEFDAYKLISERTNSGAIMGNLENFLLLRSLRTLELRVSRQSQSSTKVAKFLSKQTNIKTVRTSNSLLIFRSIILLFHLIQATNSARNR